MQRSKFLEIADGFVSLTKVIIVRGNYPNRHETVDVHPRIHGHGKIDACTENSSHSFRVNLHYIKAMQRIAYDSTTLAFKNSDEFGEWCFVVAVSMALTIYGGTRKSRPQQIVITNVFLKATDLAEANVKELIARHQIKKMKSPDFRG
jgi:hypothetical protein